jgi:predicted nucleic acid-binding protein
MKRVFLDSSVLFSAAYSSKGYARDLILLGARAQLTLVISLFVMKETRENLADHAPKTLPALELIFNLLPFEITKPTREDVQEATQIVALKDAPIPAAAKIAKVDVLVTLDQRHLLDRPELETFIAGQILRPREAYEWAMKDVD